MSEGQLKKRRAELEGVLEKAKQEFIDNLKTSVATGLMTQQEATEEPFESFATCAPFTNRISSPPAHCLRLTNNSPLSVEHGGR